MVARTARRLPPPGTHVVIEPLPPSLRDLAALLPEGTDPPADVPSDIFQAAMHTFLEQRRVDMRSLAEELGIGRATLYRRAGSRDRLLGQVLWYLTRRNLARAARKAEGLVGVERILSVIRHFLSYAHDQPSLQHFLAAEPEAALRILTSKRGIVQAGVVAQLTRLIEQEVEAGQFANSLDPHTLAYVIVRIGEGFLYADVIADDEPDVDLALTVVRQLVTR
jgi:AcrR family transcriptional regulator